MNLTSELEMAEFASTLIHTRRNISPRRLVAPGPSALQLQDILGAAATAPDHGRLQPWRFIIVPANQRERLADVFGLALLDRDPNASGFQIERAREKAHRAPFLMLAVARLVEPVTPVKPLPDLYGQNSHAMEPDVPDVERLVSFGCAIQNMLLAAHAAGFGAGLTSGQAMASLRMRALFSLQPNECPVCCLNIGTATKYKPEQLRPRIADYISDLI